jgi:type VI secretion system secreted protein Hcp
MDEPEKGQKRLTSRWYYIVYTCGRNRGMCDRRKMMPIYMKYEGIFGEITKEPYKGWIELQSAQIGAGGRPAPSPGNGVSVSEIVVTKMTDSSSPPLFKESLFGEAKKVIIDFVKIDGGRAYLRLELEGTLISSFSGGSGSGGDRPQLESLALNFRKITYSLQGPVSSQQEAAGSTEWRAATTRQNTRAQ